MAERMALSTLSSNQKGRRFWEWGPENLVLIQMKTRNANLRLFSIIKIYFQILRYMPVLLIRSTNQSPVFINLHEFYYTAGAIETILLSSDWYKEENQDKSNKDKENPTDSKSLPNDKGKGTRKPSLVSKFIDLVDTAANLIKESGFSTQFGRWTETWSTT